MMQTRQFGEPVPDQQRTTGDADAARLEDAADLDGLLDWIRRDEIGRQDAIFQAPFGRRKVHYCDYMASARAMRSFERYISEEVLPLYGNTHSSVTVTAEQSTLFLHEARLEVRNMVGSYDTDAVIFTGQGCTSAVDLLMHLLGDDLLKRLVVFAGPHEHHSNLLPWKENAKRMISIPENEHGDVDLDALERSIAAAKTAESDDSVLAGVFSGASNLTGCVTDYSAVMRILKKHGCLAFWDYAAAAPYLSIDVNGSEPADALYFSGHKFQGAIGSPGVLVVKRALMHSTRPSRIGGGTVFFVSPTETVYLREAEHREEGGTPNTVGAIRLGLALRLKRSVGPERILAREHEINRRVLARLLAHPSIVLLGPKRADRRLSVFPFLVQSPLPNGLFFHHNYIAALLNDLFGVQTRAGCVCAGPYAQHLLGIDDKLASEYLDSLREDGRLDRLHLRRVGEYSSLECLRPGAVRLSLPYFAADHEVDYVLGAIEFVASHAADFIHLYQMGGESGEWHHAKQRVFHGRKWLGHVDFRASKGLVINRPALAADKLHAAADDPFEAAEAARLEAVEESKKSAPVDGRPLFESNPAASKLRWFVLPIEMYEWRKGWNNGQQGRQSPRPFSPRNYPDAEIENAGSLETAPPSVQNGRYRDRRDESDDEDELEGDDEQGNAAAGDGAGDEEDACPTGSCFVSNNVERKIEPDRRIVVKPTPDGDANAPWRQPPKTVYLRMREAIFELNMIRDGDKVLVGLSGGKDSLSLLHTLRDFQQRAKQSRRGPFFELGAITVDPRSDSYDPSKLIPYLRQLNIPYFFEVQDIMGQARTMTSLRSICSFCSRMKRGRLMSATRLHGYNVLALGQHLDDLTESFLIAAFQNGLLTTMKANYAPRDGGGIRIIRPFVYVREKQLRQFATESEMPVVAENCPACYTAPSERARIKQQLAAQELLFPRLFDSLRSAIRPLLMVDSPDATQARQQIVENLRASQRQAKQNQEQDEEL